MGNRKEVEPVEELVATTLLRERLQHSLLLEEKNCRIEELEQMLDDEHHRVLALRAEITARNAANSELRAVCAEGAGTRPESVRASSQQAIRQVVENASGNVK